MLTAQRFARLAFGPRPSTRRRPRLAGAPWRAWYGANTNTGRTEEQHAKEVGGRASLHEDALNILRANWDALPRTWTPTGSRQSVKRDQSYTATQAHESHMLDHGISYHCKEKVSLLQKQKKEDKAGRYNEHFKYTAEDPGFLVAAADGRGNHGKSAKKR